MGLFVCLVFFCFCFCFLFFFCFFICLLLLLLVFWLFFFFFWGGGGLKDNSLNAQCNGIYCLVCCSEDASHTA